ncbi:MAG: fibronectin type III domain-containing protein [Gammaproteobacteria bacterium]|nr:fibronectin type III domain-containing protein [Gammaproteobacteria bacterium]
MTGSCLAGYTLHYGTSSQGYTGEIQITDPTTTSYVVSNPNFPSGTYYFAISAYNGLQASSPMSGEIQVTLD